MVRREGSRTESKPERTSLAVSRRDLIHPCGKPPANAARARARAVWRARWLNDRNQPPGTLRRHVR